MYWNIAAANGFKNTMANRDSLSKKMKLSEIEDTQSLARESTLWHQ